jgi:large subunit ribosomal protein LP0
MPISKARKQEYSVRMEQLLDNYSKVFIVSCDNVGSKQMQQMRQSLRKTSVLLMGKNTLMRKVLSNYIKKNPTHPYEQLMAKLKGNVGFVFTNSDLSAVKEVIESNKVPAPARIGSLAPIDVIVPAGPTSCDPGQTSFFQALQIPTKINKGRIEITNNVFLVKKGDKIGNSEAALLQKLDIKPFSYGLIIKYIYDNGVLFDAKALEYTDDVLQEKFMYAVQNITAISLGLSYPTIATIPHTLANAFKLIVAIAVQCDNYSFDKAEPFKAFLRDPTAFVVAAPQQSTTAAASTASEPAKVAEKVEVEEEEMDVGAGGMFGATEAGDY